MNQPAPQPWIVRAPRPISVWRLHQGWGKDRRRSGAYQSWLQECGQEIIAQGPRPRFDGPVAITITMGEDGVSEAFDTDNTAKAFLDVLVGMGIIRDDNRTVVKDLRLRWRDGAGADIEVTPLTVSVL